MLIDTHVHYDDEAFDEDRESLIDKLKKENYIAVNVGATVASSHAAVKLAEEYDNIYAAVGMHPDEVYELTDADMQMLEQYAGHEKVKAIGEIGLDYSREEARPELQRYWFKKQIEVAQKVKLPIIIHSRDAARDTLDIVKETDAGCNGGIVHCYSYGVELAREYLAMGFHFGIGGVVTFKNAKKLKEVVEYLPIDNIVLETDCPYLAPVPFRGTRNSSLHLPLVVEAIAQLKGLSYEEVAERTTQNAKLLYGIN